MAVVSWLRTMPFCGSSFLLPGAVVLLDGAVFGTVVSLLGAVVLLHGVVFFLFCAFEGPCVRLGRRGSLQFARFLLSEPTDAPSIFGQSLRASARSKLYGGR
ncbi:unnamed protein product, partial [Polarella glacialis]